MDIYISTIDNFVSAIFCEQIENFFTRSESELLETRYGEGENTYSKKMTLRNDFHHNNAGYLHEYMRILNECIKMFSSLTNDYIVKQSYPIFLPMLSPIQIRITF